MSEERGKQNTACVASNTTAVAGAQGETQTRCPSLSRHQVITRTQYALGPNMGAGAAHGVAVLATITTGVGVATDRRPLRLPELALSSSAPVPDWAKASKPSHGPWAVLLQLMPGAGPGPGSAREDMARSASSASSTNDMRAVVLEPVVPSRWAAVEGVHRDPRNPATLPRESVTRPSCIQRFAQQVE